MAERVNGTWPLHCEFQHVSSEHWIVYFDMLHERGGLFRDYSRARFDLGADGKVEALVIEFQDLSSGAVEGAIRFDRQD